MNRRLNLLALMAVRTGVESRAELRASARLILPGWTSRRKICRRTPALHSSPGV